MTRRSSTASWAPWCTSGAGEGGALRVFAYLAAAFVIGACFPLTLVVLLLTWPFDRDRMAASRALRWLGEVLIHAYPGWRVSIAGALPPPPATFVVVPNHQSMVDALAVATLPREMKWIGKREVFRVPWLGWALHLAGHVPVLRGDGPSGRKALARLRRYLDHGIAVGLFAEGTRSRDGTLRGFKAGPFKLAIETGVPIVPVAISGAGVAMPPDQPWIRPARIHVHILDPVPTAGLTGEDVEALRETVRQRIADALAADEAVSAPRSAPPAA